MLQQIRSGMRFNSTIGRAANREAGGNKNKQKMAGTQVGRDGLFPAWHRRRVARPCRAPCCGGWRRSPSRATRSSASAPRPGSGRLRSRCSSGTRSPQARPRGADAALRVGRSPSPPGCSRARPTVAGRRLAQLRGGGGRGVFALGEGWGGAAPGISTGGRSGGVAREQPEVRSQGRPQFRPEIRIHELSQRVGAAPGICYYHGDSLMMITTISMITSGRKNT